MGRYYSKGKLPAYKPTPQRYQYSSKVRKGDSELKAKRSVAPVSSPEMGRSSSKITSKRKGENALERSKKRQKRVINESHGSGKTRFAPKNSKKPSRNRSKSNSRNSFVDPVQTNNLFGGVDKRTKEPSNKESLPKMTHLYSRTILPPSETFNYPSNVPSQPKQRPTTAVSNYFQIDTKIISQKECKFQTSHFSLTISRWLGYAPDSGQYGPLRCSKIGSIFGSI
jgi:hypothetical protein